MDDLDQHPVLRISPPFEASQASLAPGDLSRIPHRMSPETGGIQSPHSKSASESSSQYFDADESEASQSTPKNEPLFLPSTSDDDMILEGRWENESQTSGTTTPKRSQSSAPLLSPVDSEDRHVKRPRTSPPLDSGSNQTISTTRSNSSKKRKGPDKEQVRKAIEEDYQLWYTERLEQAKAYYKDKLAKHKEELHQALADKKHQMEEMLDTEVKKQVGDLVKTITDLEGELEKRAEKIKKLEGQARRKGEIQDLEDENEDLKQEIEKLKSDVTALSTTMHVKDAEIDAQAGRIDKRNKAIHSLQEKLKAAEDEAERRRADWKEEKAELEGKLESQKEAFMIKFKSAEKDAILGIQERENQLTEEIRTLTDEFDGRINNLEKLLKESEKREKKLLEEAEEREKKAQAMAQDDDSKTSAFHQEESSELRKKLERYKAAYSALRDENVKLRQYADNQSRMSGGAESERREADKESNEAAQLQRDRRVSGQRKKEAFRTRQSAKSGDEAARPASNLPSEDESEGSLPTSPLAPPNSKATARTTEKPKSTKSSTAASRANTKEKTHREMRRDRASTPAQPILRRSVQPLPKNNGKWANLKAHAATQLQSTLRAVEVEEVAETDAEEEGQEQSDPDVSMAEEEVEVEQVILPHREKKKESVDDEDGPVASNKDAKRNSSGKRNMSKPKARKRTQRPSASGDDADSESSTGDEEEPITKASLKKLLGQFMKEATSSSSPSPSRKRNRVSAKKAKAMEEVVQEKKAESPEERNLYCELVRDTFKKKFEFEADTEFVTHVAVDNEALEQFHDDDDKGPDPNDLHIDGRGKLSSKWNQAVIDIMVRAVRDHQAEDEDGKFEELSKRSDNYIRALVYARLERLRGIWRKAQPKVKEDGEVECASEVEERMAAERDEAEKQGRAATRRRA